MSRHETIKAGLLTITWLVFSGLFSSAHSQQLNRTSGSTGKDFQISVTNSFGVRTSIDATGTVHVHLLCLEVLKAKDYNIASVVVLSVTPALFVLNPPGQKFQFTL